MFARLKTFFSSKSKESDNEPFFRYQAILEIIKRDFKIDFYGDHGIYHWQRVYLNTQKLAQYYGVESDVFELFALLHDSKREDEYKDIGHGKRAGEFVKSLIEKELIKLDDVDEERLIYACQNHTVSNKSNPLYDDLIVQICFDSDRLDIGRVGITPERKYFLTDFAKEYIQNSSMDRIQF